MTTKITLQEEINKKISEIEERIKKALNYDESLGITIYFKYGWVCEVSCYNKYEDETQQEDYEGQSLDELFKAVKEDF